jgi:hypothetical protein
MGLSLDLRNSRARTYAIMMATSNEWTRWHLTPAGWVRGHQRFDSGERVITPDPPDSVEIWEYEEYMSSSYSGSRVTTSGMERTTTRMVAARDQGTVRTLFVKFGECPEHL